MTTDKVELRDGDEFYMFCEPSTKYYRRVVGNDVVDEFGSRRGPIDSWVYKITPLEFITRTSPAAFSPLLAQLKDRAQALESELRELDDQISTLEKQASDKMNILESIQDTIFAMEESDG